MSRRRAAVKREVLPDPLYKEEMVTKFVSCMMKHGKRASAERLLYGALEHIKKGMGKKFPGYTSPVEVFRSAVENAKPMLEVKSRRVGGSNYQVPVEVRPERRQALAYRWIIEYSRKRPGRSMMDRLAAELEEAAMKKGGAVKKRDDVHKMADANRAFAHYRW